MWWAAVRQHSPWRAGPPQLQRGLNEPIQGKHKGSSLNRFQGTFRSSHHDTWAFVPGLPRVRGNDPIGTREEKLARALCMPCAPATGQRDPATLCGGHMEGWTRTGQPVGGDRKAQVTLALSIADRCPPNRASVRLNTNSEHSGPVFPVCKRTCQKITQTRRCAYNMPGYAVTWHS